MTADADLSAYDVLVVGKNALDRAGSRTAYHARARRTESHSVRTDAGRVGETVRVPRGRVWTAAGLSAESRIIRCWRDSASSTCATGAGGDDAFRRVSSTWPTSQFSDAPTVRWCGIPVSRVWRCGNRGNVASALIEKPARGDFLPILDGGYGLQYSPLIEYREGRGMVLFCQMDVTGRTESDPAAETLAHNMLEYVAAWKPAPAAEGRLCGRSCLAGPSGIGRGSRRTPIGRRSTVRR